MKISKSRKDSIENVDRAINELTEWLQSPLSTNDQAVEFWTTLNFLYTIKSLLCKDYHYVSWIPIPDSGSLTNEELVEWKKETLDWLMDIPYSNTVENQTYTITAKLLYNMEIE